MLDLRDPDQFMLALWQEMESFNASCFASGKRLLSNPNFNLHMTSAEFFAALRPMVNAHHAAMFDPAGGVAARDAIFQFFIEANAGPPGWFRLFREAFDAGVIDATALGAAARMIYLIAQCRTTDAGENHAMFLAGLRLGDRRGIMLPREFTDWEALPAMVTIYRGAVAPDAATAAKGLSWSLYRDYPRAHLLRRTLQLGSYGLRIGVSVAGAGSPRVVSAVVPRDAILAHLSLSDVRVGGDRRIEDREVLVDFERIDPASVTELRCDDLVGDVLGDFFKRGMGGLLRVQGLR